MRKFELGMLFKDPEEASKQIDHRPPSLVYRCEPVTNPQARFRGRYLLRPELDLRRFVTRAEIDWIDLKVSLGRSTQTQHLSKILGKYLSRAPHVTDPAGRERRTGTELVARIQGPEPESLSQALAALHDSHGVVAPVEIVGIEIAVDWWPVSPSSRDPFEMAIERLHLVTVLQRHFLPGPELMAGERDKPRFKCPDKGDKKGQTLKLLGKKPTAREQISTFVEYNLSMPSEVWRNWNICMHNGPTLDSTLYFGAEEADVLFRIQNKISDNRKHGDYDDLTVEERRARVEVRLKGKALRDEGFCRLDDLAGFRFEKLRHRFFPFWLPTLQPGLWWWWFEKRFFFKTGLYGLEARQWAHDELRKKRNRRLAKAEPTDPPRKRWRPGRIRETAIASPSRS